MRTVYHVKIGEKKKPIQVRKEKMPRSQHKKQNHNSFLHRCLDYLDSKKYAIDSIVGPVIWSGVALAAGAKLFDYSLEQITSINDNVNIIGTPGGKMLVTVPVIIGLYEATKYVLFGTKKSSVPLLRKIKFDGIIKESHKRNRNLYKKDNEGEVSGIRRVMSYAKNLGLTGLITATIATGAAKNTVGNIRFNLSELFYVNKGTVALSSNQTQTLEQMLIPKDNAANKQEMPLSQQALEQNLPNFNFGQATDSEIKKAMVEAELYRMTDTRWERKKAWLKKELVKKYEPLIVKWVKRYGLLPNINEATALVEGIIFQESGGNQYAKSKAGAQGLMQLMPSTAKQYGVKDRIDPDQNIMGGVGKLDDLLAQCKGNVPLALTLYNCSADAVNWAIKQSGSNDPFVFVHWLQKEPREYATKVLAATTYMVNGGIPEADMINDTEAFSGSDFKYLRKNSQGKVVFSYTVIKGDTTAGITRKFNAWDNKQGNDYNEVVYATGVVNSQGRSVGNAITPGQEVYILALKK
jgi:soluble lytic murein transglycosylase-like protein